MANVSAQLRPAQDDHVHDHRRRHPDPVRDRWPDLAYVDPVFQKFIARLLRYGVRSLFDWSQLSPEQKRLMADIPPGVQRCLDVWARWKRDEAVGRKPGAEGGDVERRERA